MTGQISPKIEDDSTIKKIRIAKLNGSNYRTWAAIPRAVIEAKDAWDAIELPGPEAETSVKSTGDGTAKGKAAESKGVTDTKVDRVMDAKARTVIMGYCGPEALSKILHLRTAKEQWDTLERSYLPTGKQQLSTALQKFYGFTPKPNASVNSIVTSLREARMDIFNIDPAQQPTDESTTVILFNSLRAIDPAYGPITLQLELQDIRKLDVIISHLEEAERRLVAMAVRPEAALQAADKKGNKGKGKEGLKCWHCEKQGHVKVKCSSWLKDTDDGRKYAAEHPQKTKTGPLPTPGAKGNLSPVEKAQVADENTDEACWRTSESGRNGQRWLVDSGATSHMTPDRMAFIEYTALTAEQFITAANGSTLPGIGRGRVRISVSVDGHARSIVLTDVLHVPQITGNLISVARLQDKGIVVETTAPPERLAMIIKYQGCKVGVASRVGRSYVLDMPTERAMPAELTTDHQEGVTDSQGQVADRQRQVTDRQVSEYTRWHQRFGHLGPQLIEKVHTAVGGLPRPVTPAKDQTICEVCALTKKVRVINRSSPERSTEPLARVFSDFWGPYREPTLTGELYMLTFTDDYTRKSWVILTKLRSVLSSEFAR